MVISSKSPSPSPNEHLSFPASSNEHAEQSSIQPQQSRQVLKDRLYIGNLHPTVDEYSLLQIFSKFGKVTKLDFLFHKAGALKGKPRGYAFIEYGSNDEALKALSMAHDKLFRGRKLVVTFAHQAPIDQAGSGTSIGIKRKGMMETGRPTTLSMLKTGLSGKHDATGNKIAMMEAKLRQMENTNPKSCSSAGSASTSRSTSIHHHPSLPVKPPPTLPTNFATGLPHSRPTPKPKSPLPSLPILPPSISQSASQLSVKGVPSVPSKQSKSSRLVGVKIGKPKERQVPPPETD